MTQTYDLIVIGAGPAGYVAAIRGAQLGMKTACVERWIDSSGKPVYGGTCLNVGCIPSKALLEATHKYHDAQHNYAKLGIKAKVSMDVGALMQHKDSMVAKLTGGIAGLLKANGVTPIQGTGKLMDATTVAVTDAKDKTTNYTAKNVLLATGSTPIEIPSLAFDGTTVVDSSGALAFEDVPETLCIVGAGVIGLELGSVWARMGSKVTLLEAVPQFLPMVDADIAKMVQRDFIKEGLDIQLGCKVQSATASGKGKKTQADVVYTNAKGEEVRTTFSKVVVAVGRKPVTQGLLAEGVPIQLDKRGFVEVDNQCRTALPNVFAVGDIVRGPMLAHKGSEEGVMAVEVMAGQATQVNYDAIPNVIYTSPEVAWVGKTAEELKDRETQSGTFPFSALGRAMANDDTRGMVKIIADKKTDQILGVHIYGQHAGELICQGVTALEFSASIEDVALTMFAHPTMSEAIHEAALAAHGHAIHMVNRKK